MSDRRYRRRLSVLTLVLFLLGLGGLGDELAELARARTDGSGRFVLRARPTPAIAAARDESGWVNVMLFAFSDHGMALATDSVAWKPSGDIRAQSAHSTPGRWVTNPADLFTPPDGRFRAAAVDSQPETERPTTLVLGGQPSETISAMPHPLKVRGIAGCCGTGRSESTRWLSGSCTSGMRGAGSSSTPTPGAPASRSASRTAAGGGPSEAATR